MIHLRVTPSTLGPDVLAPAVGALHRGGVVAFPTDTFYGLAVDPRSTAAVTSLFNLKRRPPDHPLPLIASDVDQVVDHVGTLTPLAVRLASRGWPGPLTLIIPASRHVCEAVHLSTGNVAVRVPADEVARRRPNRLSHRSRAASTC
jgi:L-threonylcarbamoyladenylate synthase